MHRRTLLSYFLVAGGFSVATIAGWFRGDAKAQTAMAQGERTMTPQAMIDLFDKHVNAELEGDLDTTLATMTDNPHLHNMPNMMGGVGPEGVRKFYQDHLVGKFFPPDVVMTRVSQTVGENQIVDEMAIRFTHTIVIDWLLPGVAPTGKPVEMIACVFVGFKDGKISHEHIYWDQASILVQIGLLDPKGLPVVGAESVQKILSLSPNAETL